MGIFGSISEAITGKLDKRSQEREEYERMQKEISFQKQQAAMERMKDMNLHASKTQARNQYNQSSGFGRLRAVNRELNLKHPEEVPNNRFSKLSEYTQKNIATREANLEKTRRLREEATRIKMERNNQKLMGREMNMLKNKYRR